MAASTTVRSAGELARRVVLATAPDELPSFDLIAGPYLEDPERAERRLRQAHDDPLGFGPGDIVDLATPVIALVSGSVITAVSDNVAKAAYDSTTRKLRSAWRKIRRKPDEPLELPPTPLTKAQLAEVRQIALDRALALGMKRAKAEALADAVVAALVLRDDPATDPTTDDDEPRGRRGAAG